jgi:hypothetical protein
VLFSYDRPAKAEPMEPAEVAVTESDAEVMDPEGGGWGFGFAEPPPEPEDEDPFADPQAGRRDDAARAIAP